VPVWGAIAIALASILRSKPRMLFRAFGLIWLLAGVLPALWFFQANA
jgi:hypothetical protein